MIRASSAARSVALSVVALALTASGVVGQQWDGSGPASGPYEIEIWKGRREMVLREGARVVRRFQVALGYNPERSKQFQGDSRTPEGRYYVCEKRPQSSFYRFLGISYPNLDDAERGYVKGLISANEWADIFVPYLRREVPSWRTALGGRVGIHGLGGRYRVGDWTHGCIAVSDEEIDFLYHRVSVGTPVIINE